MIRLCSPENLPCVAHDFVFRFLIETHGAGIMLAVIIATAAATAFATIRE